MYNCALQYNLDSVLLSNIVMTDHIDMSFSGASLIL